MVRVVAETVAKAFGEVEQVRARIPRKIHKDTSQDRLINPRVSVITIFYNVDKFLGEAIESVLAQDYRDFEYLLVDDGSTDESGAIARSYADRDPSRIRYLHHPGRENRGMSASRNLGIRESRGEFVSFIDGDDRWRPFKLKEQVGLLDRMPDVDAVCGSVNYWASHCGGNDLIISTGHLRDQRIQPGAAILKLYPLGIANAPSMSDLIFRRSSILAVGGFEEIFAGAYEDQAFLAKFYLESTLYVTTKVWSDYRLHDTSCMAEVERDGTYHLVRRTFLEWFQRYFAESRHRNNLHVWFALGRAMRPYRTHMPTTTRKTVRDAVSRSPVGSTFRTAKTVVRRLRTWLAPGPAILMYHRVAEERFDPWGLAVSPANFSSQLEWIAQNRTPLALREFAELHRQGRLPRNAIALTFDDGYACNAKVAAPLLDLFRIPATIFLSADLIELGRECWWDELERIVFHSKEPVLRFDGAEISLGNREPADDLWPAGSPPRTPRQLGYRQLWSQLYNLKPDELETRLKGLRRQSRVSDTPRQSHRLLTPMEISKFRSEFVDFGSHALSHPLLPLLGSEQKRREIEKSVERCAELTGVQPLCFAYPYGIYDLESAEIVEEAGFVCACKADGWFVTQKTNRFALPRIAVGNWDPRTLARMLGRP